MIEKVRLDTFFYLISPYFLRLQHCHIAYNEYRDAWRQASCYISDGCGERKNIGQSCLHAHTIFLILVILSRLAWSLDMSNSTCRRVTPHSYCDGEQASECVVVSMGLCGEQWTVLCRVWLMLMVGRNL